MNTMNIPGLARILVVGADAAAGQRLAALMAKAGAAVAMATRLQEAEAAVATRRCDVVFAGDAGDADVWAVLAALRSRAPAAAVILTPGMDREVGVLAAMRAGALDVLAADANDDRVLATVRRCLDEQQLRSTAERCAERARELAPGAFIGLSPAMRAVTARLGEVARAADAPVLICGEPGTGKELAARCVHAASDRRHGPFVVLNCAGWAEGQLDLELFGCEPGAVPSAAGAAREGCIVQADGGTLYLDAIDAIDRTTQARLLRVLQERTIRRIGGSHDLFVDVRIVAATTADLAAAVQRREFRSDLFLALEAMAIRLPALRDHAEDIPLLAHYFLGRARAEMGKGIAGFTEEALEILGEYAWPGNVRELRNAIERAAMAVQQGPIDEAHLPPFSGGRLDGRDVISRGQLSLEVRDRSLRGVEGQLVARVLAETGWNISRAAGILGINRTTLYNKIKLHGLRREIEARGPRA